MTAEAAKELAISILDSRDEYSAAVKLLELYTEAYTKGYKDAAHVAGIKI